MSSSPESAPLSESTGPEWLPTAEAMAHFRPTKEQRDRLRYWDFYLYWVDYAVRKQNGETIEAPAQFRSNR